MLLPSTSYVVVLGKDRSGTVIGRPDQADNLRPLTQRPRNTSLVPLPPKPASRRPRRRTMEIKVSMVMLTYLKIRKTMTSSEHSCSNLGQTWTGLNEGTSDLSRLIRIRTLSSTRAVRKKAWVVKWMTSWLSIKTWATI